MKMSLTTINKTLVLYTLLNITTTNSYRFHCPSDAQILSVGLDNPDYRKIIIDTHNELRQELSMGKVLTQPIAYDLLDMEYDVILETKARRVSEQCDDKKVNITDDRFLVGQNIAIERSARYDVSMKQNWREVITSWFNDHKNYIFGQPIKENTEHYTQLVWGETYLVGCDFIMYKDYSDRISSYHKLYSCNYGPAGNMKGRAPYKTSHHVKP